MPSSSVPSTSPLLTPDDSTVSHLTSSDFSSPPSPLVDDTSKSQCDDDPFLFSLFPHLSLLSSSGALAHLDLLKRQADSMRASHLTSSNQIHLGVFTLPAFQALMSIINALRSKAPSMESEELVTTDSQSGSTDGYSSASSGDRQHLSPSQHEREIQAVGAIHEEGMDISYVNGFVHTTAIVPISEDSSAASFSVAVDPPPSERASTPPVDTTEEAPPPALVVERDRFCKPSRLITDYPSKPFLMTPIHLERQYVTSRKNLDQMAAEEKSELCTVTVRWMGRPAENELFLVATDVCALINIRKSNTAKTVAQFSDTEKVSMPVHCSSGKGSSTHILTVLTMAGVRRLLTTSRSVLSSALLEYLTRIVQHLHAYPHYVPVNDPTKPSVVPFKDASAPLSEPQVKMEGWTSEVSGNGESVTPKGSAPSPSTSSSPRTVSGRKQQRPKKEREVRSSIKRMKEEAPLPSPPGDHQHGERSDDHYFSHLHSHSHSPPPHFAPAYQTHSPTSSHVSYQYPPSHPLFLSSNLSPPFGPSAPMSGSPSLDYHNQSQYVQYIQPAPSSPSAVFGSHPPYYDRPRGSDGTTQPSHNHRPSHQRPSPSSSHYLHSSAWGHYGHSAGQGYGGYNGLHVHHHNAHPPPPPPLPPPASSSPSPHHSHNNRVIQSASPVGDHRASSPHFS